MRFVLAITLAFALSGCSKRTSPNSVNSGLHLESTLPARFIEDLNRADAIYLTTFAIEGIKYEQRISRELRPPPTSSRRLAIGHIRASDFTKKDTRYPDEELMLNYFPYKELLPDGSTITANGFPIYDKVLYFEQYYIPMNLVLEYIEGMPSRTMLKHAEHDGGGQPAARPESK